MAIPRARPPHLEKLERDCIRLIDAIAELRREGAKQTLRGIAERAGMSKDEVNRYLNPRVNELYNLDRLVRVRGSNRPLYNYLIVSGPPRVEEGQWVGIETNTSKFVLFRAVAQRLGYDVKYVGDRGTIVDLVYQGIERMTVERMGKVFATQEPILHLDPT
jgi:transcriptional regulator with XRE-family HTH domain